MYSGMSHCRLQKSRDKEFYAALVLITAVFFEIIKLKKMTEVAMKKTLIHVQKEFCAECSLALTRFMQNMEGIESVEEEEGTIAITFDETKIGEGRVKQIARDNIEKLGYQLTM